MSRLKYLNQMVENNLEQDEHPCAENYGSHYKAPCIEDLTHSQMHCVQCCMNTERNWFKIITDLEAVVCQD